MTITLTTFVPGTKAKADEVNANFTTLKNALDTKASIDGDSNQIFEVATGTENSHAVNKAQLTTLTNTLNAAIDKTGAKFCARSGNTTNGEADLFAILNSTKIVAKIAGSYDNLVIADYLGTPNTISSAPATIDLSGNADGTYNIFITTAGVVYILNNTIYKQPARPTMVVGDVWLNTSCEPFKCIKYSGSNDVAFSDVPIGRLTFKTNAITSLTTFPFNQNGYNITSQTQISSGSKLSASIASCIMPDYSKGSSQAFSTTYQAPTNGFIFTSGRFSGTLYISYDNTNWTTLSINGFGDQGYASSAFFPIAKNTYYKLTVGNVSGSSLIFFPCLAT